MSLGLTTLVLNTETMSITGYTNHQFKGMSVVDGHLFGVKDDGIYLLEGDTDNGTQINSEFLTGSTDMDQDRLKTVNMVHADSIGEFDVLVGIDGTVHQVEFNGRARPGRGARGMQLSFGLRSKSGSKLAVNSIEPVIDISRKRVL
jgi:hypothetical protein